MKEDRAAPDAQQHSSVGVLLERLQSLERRHLEFVGYCSSALKEHEANLKAKLATAKLKSSSLAKGLSSHEQNRERQRIEQELAFVASAQRRLPPSDYTEQLQGFTLDLDGLFSQLSHRSLSKDRLEAFKIQILELFQRHSKAPLYRTIEDSDSKPLSDRREKSRSSLTSEMLSKIKARPKQQQASEGGSIQADYLSLQVEYRTLVKKHSSTTQALQESEANLDRARSNIKLLQATLKDCADLQDFEVRLSPTSGGLRSESAVGSPRHRLKMRTQSAIISVTNTQPNSALASRASSPPLSARNMGLDYLDLQAQLLQASKECGDHKAKRADFEAKLTKYRVLIKKLKQSQSLEKKRLELTIEKLQARLLEVSEKVQDLTNSASAMLYSWTSRERPYFDSEGVQLQELVKGLGRLKPKVGLTPGNSQVNTPKRLSMMQSLQSSFEDKKETHGWEDNQTALRRSQLNTLNASPNFGHDDLNKRGALKSKLGDSEQGGHSTQQFEQATHAVKADRRYKPEHNLKAYYSALHDQPRTSLHASLIPESTRSTLEIPTLLLPSDSIKRPQDGLYSGKLSQIPVEFDDIPLKTSIGLTSALSKLHDLEVQQGQLKDELKEKAAEIEDYRRNKRSLSANLRALEQENIRLKKLNEASKAELTKTEQERAELQETVEQMQGDGKNISPSFYVRRTNPDFLNSSDASNIEAPSADELLAWREGDHEGSSTMVKLIDKYVEKEKGQDLDISLDF